jgi:hypothetical protein
LDEGCEKCAVRLMAGPWFCARASSVDVAECILVAELAKKAKARKATAKKAKRRSTKRVKREAAHVEHTPPRPW